MINVIDLLIDLGLASMIADYEKGDYKKILEVIKLIDSEDARKLENYLDPPTPTFSSDGDTLDLNVLYISSNSIKHVKIGDGYFFIHTSIPDKTIIKALSMEFQGTSIKITTN